LLLAVQAVGAGVSACQPVGKLSVTSCWEKHRTGEKCLSRERPKLPQRRPNNKNTIRLCCCRAAKAKKKSSSRSSLAPVAHTVRFALPFHTFPHHRLQSEFGD